MTTSYYSRQLRKTPQGMSYSTEEDFKNEDEVFALIEEKWGCKTHRFPQFHQIDGYTVRDDRMESLVEVKARSHASTKFDTCFLNARKFMALWMASVGFNVPAYYVVKFTDTILYIEIGEVDGSQQKIAGCKRIVKAQSDIEPCVLVPISSMKKL